MPEPFDQDIKNCCQLVVTSVRPSSILYVGRSVLMVVEEFTAQGIPAFGYEQNEFPPLYTWVPSDPSFNGKTDHPSWDVMIFSGSILPDLIRVPAEEFIRPFANPRLVLVMLSPSEVPLPFTEVAGWLKAAGYMPDLFGEAWLDSNLLCFVYQPNTAADAAALLNLYEADWWRLAQLSHKRRKLLAEYFMEIVGINNELRYSNSALKAEHKAVLEQEIPRLIDWGHGLEQEIQNHQQWNESLQQEILRRDEEIHRRGEEIQRLSGWIKDLENRQAAFEASNPGKLLRIWQGAKQMLRFGGKRGRG